MALIIQCQAVTVKKCHFTKTLQNKMLFNKVLTVFKACSLLRSVFGTLFQIE